VTGRGSNEGEEKKRETSRVSGGDRSEPDSLKSKQTNDVIIVVDDDDDVVAPSTGS
jgi:hypothetical protein